jgi:[ribosomal protein S5]-alanine N-acetyltransferase
MSRYRSFETGRIFIRPTTESDVALILELFNTPKWLQFVGDRDIRSLKIAREYIRTRIAGQFERLGFGNYTLIRKTDQVPLGCCGLYDREGVPGIDLGFALLPAFEGQGYAYEAASRLKEAALTDFHLREIYGITNPDNLASQKLLQKLGMRRIDEMNLQPAGEARLLFHMTLQ